MKKRKYISPKTEVCELYLEPFLDDSSVNEDLITDLDTDADGGESF